MQSSENNTIFQFEKGFKFLEHTWKQKLLINPAFSIRAWAKSMGLKSHVPLYLMIQGKRAVPKKYLPALVKSLNLTVQQAIYLELLLELDFTKENESKEYLYQKIRALSPTGTSQFYQLEQYEMIKNPLATLLLEMSQLPGFMNDEAKIKKQLCTQHSESEIKETLERLLRLGLLEKVENKKLKKVHKNLTSIPDLKQKAVQEYHQSVLALAESALQTLETDQREFGSYSFNMDSTKMPQAKDWLRKMFTSFFNEFEAKPGQGDATFQICLQLFPATNLFKIKKEKK